MPTSNSGSDNADTVVVGLLGAVSIVRDGVRMPLPGGRSRALLVALAVRPGRSRTAASLIEDVWSDAVPRSPKNALQTQISRLRSALPAGILEIGASGYRLALGDEQVDLTLARVLADAAAAAVALENFADACAVVTRARALWHGEAGADLSGGDIADAVRRAADGTAADLDVTETAALLGLGKFDAALPLARARVAADEYDEVACIDLMRTLHGMGRSNEALEVYARLRGRLAEHLGTDPSPVATALNAEILQGPSAVRAPLAIGLRAAPNELIGRADDIVAIESIMALSRVTTILGPGGSGKTRLAHEIGTRAAHRMPVALVELASVRNGEDVVAAISGTLGLSEMDLTASGIAYVRVHSARQRLTEALSAKPTLLILDNCEHVVAEVADVVAELITASDQVRVLTTSRSPLSITAESAYPLGSLAVLAAGSPATELFVARARAVRRTVNLDPDEVARLCRTVDGLPLAIELAAARVSAMSVEEINVRLVQRFSLLQSRDRTRPERHRTLHAVIDWSWNLLEPGEQAALRRLCRFSGGFTLDAAVAVAQWDGSTDIARALDGLVNQSLLSVTETAGAVRYHMLETVREYGEEQLGDDEAAAVRARMLEWAEQLAREVVRGYRSGVQVASVHKIEAEHDNLLAMLRLSHARSDWGYVYSLFSALGTFWAIRGAHSEILNWAPRMLTAEADGPDLDWVDDDLIVLGHVLVASHLAFRGLSRDLARARIRLRRVLRRRTEVDPGLRFSSELMVRRVDGTGLARMLAVGTRSADARVRVAALGARATIRENSGDLYGAGRDALLAKQVAEDLSETWAVASAAQTLGGVFAQTGEHDRAVEQYTDAAQRLWELHAYEESLQIRGFLGIALVSSGRVDEGLAVMDGIAEFDGAGTLDLQASSSGYQNLAAVAATRAEANLAAGRIDEGLKLYRTAVEYAGTSQDQFGDGYLTMLVSACVDAHVLTGRTVDIAEAANGLRDLFAARSGLNGFWDLPQLGAVACAVGSYEIASGKDPVRGIRLLVLSAKIVARQDYPSMRPALHMAAARVSIGDDMVDAALSRTAGMNRTSATAAIKAELFDGRP